MYTEDLEAVSNAAKAKQMLLKNNPLGYFTAAMLAGIFIGFGVLLAFTVGATLHEMPYAKLAMGASFGIALSLVIMAGGELFTGNNFVMAVGLLLKTVRLKQSLWLWFVCWMGNLTGAVLLAAVFWGSGLADGTVGAFMAESAAAKMAIPLLPLLLRGILCNVLVCLATWCSFRLKSESAKLIIIFWCLLAFVAIGLEHAIANMTLLTVALLHPAGAAVSVSGWVYNLLAATAGNVIGGVFFLAVPYSYIARTDAAQNMTDDS